MKYDPSLMNDIIRWYGLEGEPEFQHERNHWQQWRAAVTYITLPKTVRMGTKAYATKMNGTTFIKGKWRIA